MLINEINDKYPLRIESCNNKVITVSGIKYTNPICITNQNIILINKSKVSDLDLSDFAMAIQAKPEIILIGTGHKHIFLASQLVAILSSHGISLESMNTQSACHTYMILRSEGRDVWTWLWPDIEK